MYTTTQIREMMAEKEAQVRGLAQFGVVLTEDQIRATMQEYYRTLEKEGIIPDLETQVSVSPANPQNPVQHFEYNEITDLYLPHLDEETKNEAIKLANKIELLRMSINERVERGVIIPDAEMASLNNMIKSFKKMTRTDYYHATTDKVKRGVSKVVDFTFGTVVGELDNRSQEFVTGVEDVTCDLIDGASKLASTSIDFTSNLTQGAVRLGGKAVRGVLKTGFGLFRK